MSRSDTPAIAVSLAFGPLFDGKAVAYHIAREVKAGNDLSIGVKGLLCHIRIQTA